MVTSVRHSSCLTTKTVSHHKDRTTHKPVLRDRSRELYPRQRTDASTVAAVAAAAAFPPEALPPAGLAELQPSSPPLEVEVEVAVDAGEGVTGTGGGVSASPPAFAADPAAAGGVAGGAPPVLSPPLSPKPPKQPNRGQVSGCSMEYDGNQEPFIIKIDYIRMAYCNSSTV